MKPSGLETLTTRVRWRDAPVQEQEGVRGRERLKMPAAGSPTTFGGPIATPNLMRVAEVGLRYNRFHVTALCSPKRAAMLTGRDQHQVGMGSAAEFPGRFPGYTGHVPRSCAPLPKKLKEDGTHD